MLICPCLEQMWLCNLVYTVRCKSFDFSGLGVASLNCFTGKTASDRHDKAVATDPYPHLPAAATPATGLLSSKRKAGCHPANLDRKKEQKISLI
jgi:hypothetical protein